MNLNDSVDGPTSEAKCEAEDFFGFARKKHEKRFWGSRPSHKASQSVESLSIAYRSLNFHINSTSAVR